MQPLVGTNVNADGFSEFTTGLVPDVEIPESLNNLGELGNPTEPLLAAALDQINGTTGKYYLSTTPENLQIKTITSSNKMKPFRDVMLQDTKKIFN